MNRQVAEQMLEAFTSRDLGDALSQAKQNTSGSKDERIRRLIALDLPATALLDLFVADALRGACEVSDVPFGGRRKAELAQGLISKFDANQTIGQQLTGAFQQLVKAPERMLEHVIAKPAASPIPQGTGIVVWMPPIHGRPPSFREVIIGLLLEMQTSSSLNDRLREIGCEPRGTVNERKSLYWDRTNLHRCSTHDFLLKVVSELREAEASWSQDLCVRLGLNPNGTKARLIRRIHRCVASHEGMLRHWLGGSGPALNDVHVAVDWYPLYQRRSGERDHYEEFKETMVDFYGDQLVHAEHPVPYANGLKIDFHIGHPLDDRGGVGVEFKMPKTNDDIQKATGQVLQYSRRYSQSLVVVILPQCLDARLLVPFVEQLRAIGAAPIVKDLWA